jgi:hypothetical protein
VVLSEPSPEKPVQGFVLGIYCPFTSGPNLPLMVVLDLTFATSLSLVLFGTSFLNHAQISDHEAQFPLVSPGGSLADTPAQLLEA